VRTCDFRLIGNGKMGSVTQAGQKTFQAAIHRQIVPSEMERHYPVYFSLSTRVPYLLHIYTKY
jgi:hypothetical protein